MGIAQFGAPATEIFPPWGWKEKLPREDFGAGIGEETSVLVDSPNLSIALFFILFFIFENSPYLFCYAL
jgi:hypothetical protein